MNPSITIYAGELRTFYMTALSRLGFDTSNARTLCEIFLATSDYHALSVLLERVKERAVDPKVRPRLEKKKRRAVTIEGGLTEPHLTCLLAIETACETAAAEGVGMTIVRGLLPVVKLRIYERVAAAHGLIAEIKEASYEADSNAEGTDDDTAHAAPHLHKVTHSFLAVDPGHFGVREEMTSLIVEFAQKAGDPGARAPKSIDPTFENEGTLRTYTGNVTAIFRNNSLIEVPSDIADEWKEIAAALEMGEDLIPDFLSQNRAEEVLPE